MGLSVCLCLVEDGGSCVWLEAWGLVRGGEERETSFRQGDDGEKAEVDDVMKVLGFWYDEDDNGTQLQIRIIGGCPQVGGWIYQQEMGWERG